MTHIGALCHREQKGAIVPLDADLTEMPDSERCAPGARETLYVGCIRDGVATYINVLLRNTCTEILQ